MGVWTPVANIKRVTPRRHVLKPRKKTDLTRHFDSAEVDIKSKDFEDYPKLKKAVLGRAVEEAICRKEMKEAAQGIDRLRSSDKTRGWSGTKEIRKLRDAAKS